MRPSPLEVHLPWPGLEVGIAVVEQGVRDVLRGVRGVRWGWKFFLHVAKCIVFLFRKWSRW
jgi:hypothetical protein